MIDAEVAAFLLDMLGKASLSPLDPNLADTAALVVRAREQLAAAAQTAQAPAET